MTEKFHVNAGELLTISDDGSTLIKNNDIHPTAIIYPGVVLGKNITIRAYAVIGSPAEKEGHFHESGKGVFIGDDTIISEFVTIHSGVERMTTVGDNCRLLRGSHVGHDAYIGNNCTISCNVLIGGHSEIQRGANLGLGAILHQFSKVGAWAFVGAGAVIPKRKRIVPGNTYVGNPVRFLKNNTIGLQRQGVAQAELQAAVHEYYAATSDWKS